METDETLEEVYGEEKLELLQRPEIKEGSEKERGSSELSDDGNARTLLDGDGGSKGYQLHTGMVVPSWRYEESGERAYLHVNIMSIL